MSKEQLLFIVTAFTLAQHFPSASINSSKNELLRANYKDNFKTTYKFFKELHDSIFNEPPQL